MKNILRNKRNLWYLAGMLFGLIAIVVGIVCFSTFTGRYGSLSKVSFGGDFYTEMHQVTRVAANRLGDISEMLGKLFGAFFLLAGAVDICAFGSKLTAAAKKEELPQAASLEAAPLKAAPLAAAPWGAAPSAAAPVKAAPLAASPVEAAPASPPVEAAPVETASAASEEREP